MAIHREKIWHHLDDDEYNELKKSEKIKKLPSFGLPDAIVMGVGVGFMIDSIRLGDLATLAFFAILLFPSFIGLYQHFKIRYSND